MRSLFLMKINYTVVCNMNSINFFLFFWTMSKRILHCIRSAAILPNDSEHELIIPKYISFMKNSLINPVYINHKWIEVFSLSSALWESSKIMLENFWGSWWILWKPIANGFFERGFTLSLSLSLSLSIHVHANCWDTDEVQWIVPADGLFDQKLSPTNFSLFFSSVFIPPHTGNEPNRAKHNYGYFEVIWVYMVVVSLLNYSIHIALIYMIFHEKITHFIVSYATRVTYEAPLVKWKNLRK